MPSLTSAPTASVIETEKPKSYAGPQDEGHESFDLPTPRPISKHSRHWPSLEGHAEQVYGAIMPNALSTPRPELRREGFTWDSTPTTSDDDQTFARRQR